MIKYIRIFLLVSIVINSILVLSEINIGILSLIVISNIIIVFVVLYSISFNLSNPVTIFSLVFLLYTISGSYLTIEGILDSSYRYIESILLHFVALDVFLMVAFIPNRKFTLNGSYIDKLETSVKINFIFLFFISLLYLYSVYTAGFISKSEKALLSGGLNSFGFIYYMLATIFYLMLIKRFREKRAVSLFLLLSIIFFFIPLIVTGERNILAKYIIGATIIYHVYTNRLKSKYILPLFILMFLGAPLTNALKMGVGNLDAIYTHDFLTQAMYSEFKSSVRNLAYIITDKGVGLFSPTFESRFLNDITRALVPGFLVGRSVETTTVWFNLEYFTRFYEKGGGAGFSQVAYGYINLGIVGVIIWFSLLGYILRKIYIKALVSPMWLVVYASLVSTACLTIRNDLAAPLSQSVKHIGLTLLFLYFIRHFLKRRS